MLTNLTNTACDMRVLGRVTYWLHEDLVITYDVTPTLAEENFDNRNGILMWVLHMEAGQSAHIQGFHPHAMPW